MHLSCVRRPGRFLRAALWISLKSLLKHVKNYDHLIPHSVSALSTPINYSDYERAASKRAKNNIYAPLGLFISNRNICGRSGARLVIKKAGAAEEFFPKSPVLLLREVPHFCLQRIVVYKLIHHFVPALFQAHFQNQKKPAFI